VNNGIVEVKTIEQFDRLSDREKMVAYITFFRLDLYNNGLHCGPKAIQQKLMDEDIAPIPSTSTIARVLKKQCLTNGRTGYYEEEHLTEEADGLEKY
jgi:hypothetical protein